MAGQSSQFFYQHCRLGSDWEATENKRELAIISVMQELRGQGPGQEGRPGREVPALQGDGRAVS
jgi:hypothetical protein